MSIKGLRGIYGQRPERGGVTLKNFFFDFSAPACAKKWHNVGNEAINLYRIRNHLKLHWYNLLIQGVL